MHFDFNGKYTNTEEEEKKRFAKQIHGNICTKCCLFFSLKLFELFIFENQSKKKKNRSRRKCCQNDDYFETKMIGKKCQHDGMISKGNETNNSERESRLKSWMQISTSKQN